MNLEVIPSNSCLSSDMDREIFNADDIKRYTRASLYLLRNEYGSQKRPECSLRYELQVLGLWKRNFAQNVNNVINESSSQPSLINFPSDRNFRLNTSNSNNAAQLSTYLTTNSGYHNNQKTYIDHRSISSAHLMPAFAKRRIIANCNMVNPRSECINECKDPNFTKRQLIKERTFENSQKPDISNISPEKKSNVDNDIDQYSEQEILTSVSLSSTTPSKIHNVNQERRIGSGRLLSRDINWDYRGQEKDRTIPVLSKEISVSNQQLNQKRNMVRYNERMERRVYDRNLNEFGEKVESFKNDILKSVNSRFITPNENIKSDYTSNRQLLHGRIRRNHFNECRTEPEWFSEGPTSKLDTIELRGFEEIDDVAAIQNISDEKSETTYKGTDDLDIQNKESPERNKILGCLERNISEVTKNIANQNIFVMNNKPNKTFFEKLQNPKTKNELKNKSFNNFQKNTDINNYNNNDSLKAIFNIENYLSIDSLESTIMCNDQHKDFDDFGNSRFTQWFANKRDQSLNKSKQCSENVTEPKSENENCEKNMLMEFFQNNKFPTNGILDAAQPSVIAIPSVEELEARMRNTKFLNNEYKSSKEIVESPKKQIMKDLQNTQVNLPPTHEVEAFKKLLEQLSAGRKLQSSTFVDESNQAKHSSNETQLNTLATGNFQILQVDQQQTRLALPIAVQQQLIIPQNYTHPDQNLIALISPQISSGFIDQQKKSQVQNQELSQLRQELQRNSRSTTPQLVGQGEKLNDNSSSHSPINLEDQFSSLVVNENSKLQENRIVHQSTISGLGVNILPQENSNPITMQRFVHTNSPTPLAFTPTSVLRKMTAEKENSTPQQQTVVNKLYQSEQQNQTQLQNVLLQPQSPRMILGGSNHPTQQHQQHNSNNAIENLQFISQQASNAPEQILHNLHMKWPTNLMHQNQSLHKPIGRPILKGHLPVPSNQQSQKQQTVQQIAEVSIASKMELHQMQQNRLKSKSICQNIINQQQPTIQHFPNQISQSHSSNMSMHLAQHQIYQQQRALNIHRHRQHVMQLQHHQQHNQIDSSGPPTIPNVGNENGGINYQRDGRLSPTSNQLAQWFSPELLAQATAGKLPLININQALSLEEFERSIQHSSTAVHN